ncbi:MAG: RNase H family protein [Ignavibacteria bacterium]
MLKKTIKKLDAIYKNIGYEADVDGAYRDEVTTYASVIRKDGEIVTELTGVVNPEEVDGSHQIAGEIRGIIETLKWCKIHNIQTIRIYYDYLGLYMWATGGWKAKKKVSINYVQFMKNNTIKIEWVKIPAHSNYRWNEYADKLAKETLIKYISKGVK